MVSLTHEEHLIALPGGFGKGELDCITLCISKKFSFVTNERKVVNYCRERGIDYVTLAHILRALWEFKIMTKDEMRQLIAEIEKMDKVVVVLKDEILN